VQEIVLELEARVAQFVACLARHSEGLSGAEEEDAAVLKSADSVSQVARMVPCREAEVGEEEVSGSLAQGAAELVVVEPRLGVLLRRRR
jgi:hypothetical protein